MNQSTISFALGKIGILEKTLVSPSLLEEIVKLNLGEALSKIKDTFLCQENLKRENLYWEEIFIREGEMLKEICQQLLPQEELRGFFQEVENPYSLVEFLQKGGKYQKDLKEFIKFYLIILDILNFLRIKTYQLKEEYYLDGDKFRLPQDLERRLFFALNPKTKPFFQEAEEILKREKNYLLHFLMKKYLVGFWEEKKKELLSLGIIFWFYFAKKLNLEVIKFIIGVLDYSLDREKAKEVIKVVYG